MKEEFVYIEDKNLLKAINKHLNNEECLCGGGCFCGISKEDMESLTELNLRYEKIKSIKSLEYAVNLEKLYLGNNELEDLSPLASLVNLEELDLIFNKINDLSPLKKLINLKKLDLSYNELEDLSPLANLINLEGLGLESNKISDVSPLENLVNLEYLGLESNKISDVSHLKSLINLERLELNYNNISDLSQLINLKKVDVDARNQRVYMSNFEDVKIKNRYNEFLNLKPIVETCFDKRESMYEIKVAVFSDSRNGRSKDVFSGEVVVSI